MAKARDQPIESVNEETQKILKDATRQVEEKYPDRVRIKQILSEEGPSLEDIRVELREL